MRINRLLADVCLFSSFICIKCQNCKWYYIYMAFINENILKNSFIESCFSGY